MFARLEERNGLRRDMNGCTSPGIAADPRGPMFDGEGPETAQFNPVSTFQGGRNLVENGTYDSLHFAMDEMRMPFREPLDQF